MGRLGRFVQHAGWPQVVGMGAAILGFFAWGIITAADGRWSHPLVWTPAFFVLALRISLTPAGGAWTRGRTLLAGALHIAAVVSMTIGFMRNDEWFFWLGLGVGVWLGMGEWFWFASGMRYLGQIAGAKASAQPPPPTLRPCP